MGRRQPLLLLSSDPPPASWSIAPSNIIILFARSVDANNPKQLGRWVDFSTVKTRFMGVVMSQPDRFIHYLFNTKIF
jgi:hypothetical protein